MASVYYPSLNFISSLAESFMKIRHSIIVWEKFVSSFLYRIKTTVLDIPEEPNAKTA